MFRVQFSATDTNDFYVKLLDNARFLFNLEQDALANLSNAAALIGINMPRINWSGFYLWREEQLILGPFWGKPACTRIAPGSGVCGKAVSTREVQRIDDVLRFPGHIACDEASRSELVIPLILPDECLVGVLDIDSPEEARFSECDQQGMLDFAAILIAKSDWRACK